MRVSVVLSPRPQVQKLQQQRDEKQEELDTLKATPIKDLWERDLDAFLEAFEVRFSHCLPAFSHCKRGCPVGY